ncbi:MAG: DUF4397 domain-containing protein [Humibacillus sp.]|nr:DUF4397 domain-containing protein [Humibacillus sp.]MDN5778021.1 DUF4397 domain-containing protein [Humibacillus sp.]
MSAITITHRSRLAGVLLAAAALVLGLCSPALAAGGSSSSATPPGKGWIRAGHFVPGFGDARVDLAPKGSPAGTSIVMSPDAAYGDVTSYQKLQPGPYVVTIRAAGTAADSAPMLSRSFEIKAGAANTIAVLGTAAAPRLAVLDDQLSPPKGGTATVRLLSATSKAPSLTVTAAGGPTIAADAVLGQVTDYTTVPEGTWRLDLTGSATPSQQTVTLGSGKVYTAVALDGDAGTVTIKLITDASGVTATPKGAAEAGEGGVALASAARDGRLSAPNGGLDTAVVGSLLLLAALGAVGARRRRTPVATIAGAATGHRRS